MTVVVATRNRADELETCLERLAALPERPRVVVVDNASSDDTAARVARFPGVAYVGLPVNAGAAARNVGAARATTPLVAFCDDDSAWDPGSLGRAAALFAALPDAAVVAARVVVHDRELDPTSALMADSPLGSPELSPPLPAGTTRYVLGFLACAAVVRRQAFLSVGGFAPWLGIGGEEELLAIDLAAAGWRLVYDDAACVRHYPSTRRDRSGRRRLGARNALLVAALRRPPSAALRRARRILRAGAHRDLAALAGTLEAAWRLPGLARLRRPVPSWLEEDLCRLEATSPQDT